MPVQDFVAVFPDPITQLKRLGGVEGKDYFLQERFIARIQDQEFFIHCRATLPLKDVENGVGFGLWVKVTAEDFHLFLQSVENTDLFKNFRITGSLANTWPGFGETYGDRVRLETLPQETKVYITQYLSEPKNISMRRALLASNDDQDTKDHVRALAMQYLLDFQNFADASDQQKFVDLN